MRTERIAVIKLSHKQDKDWTKNFQKSAEGTKVDDVVDTVKEHGNDPLFLKAVSEYAKKARSE